jgi:hypothetical protein
MKYKIACNWKKKKKKKKQKYFGGKPNLHQSKFEFYPEASALIFQLRMPSAVKIMLSYTVVMKQAHRAKNRKIGREGGTTNQNLRDNSSRYID